MSNLLVFLNEILRENHNSNIISLYEGFHRDIVARVEPEMAYLLLEQEMSGFELLCLMYLSLSLIFKVQKIM